MCAKSAVIFLSAEKPAAGGGSVLMPTKVGEKVLKVKKCQKLFKIFCYNVINIFLN